MRSAKVYIMTASVVLLLNISSAIEAQSSKGEYQALSERQQGIVLISAYTAKGELDQLQDALHSGLDNGLTINEIKEVLVHLYAYCGFPRSIRGLQTFMAVLDDRKANGITDELGPEASPIMDQRSKYKRGVETLYELTGEKWGNPESGYGAFAPAVDRFLKEHLFADIFERDALTYQQRELVTISVLGSIDGLEPMLGSHLNISLNSGLTSEQLLHFVNIIESTVGEEKAIKAQNVLNQVLENRNSK